MALAPSSAQVCTACGETKPLTEFGRDTRSVSRKGYKACCRPCNSARTKAWKQKTGYKIPRERMRFYSIRSMYGLTEADYTAILMRQNGRCAICAQPPPPDKLLLVDHDHATGAVRGLLCRLCNSAIGMLSDDPKLVEVALAYLRNAEELQRGESV